MADTLITFVLNNKETQATCSPTSSILEAALIARINPPYSCLEGICGTCSALLEQGEVDSIEGYITDKSENRAIRTCQAQPRSESLKINYDKV